LVQKYHIQSRAESFEKRGEDRSVSQKAQENEENILYGPAISTFLTCSCTGNTDLSRNENPFEEKEDNKTTM